jgi:replicative DNA helicase
MNYDKLLLSRALNDRDLTPLLMRGVKATWFADDQDSNVWRFIEEHYSLYGECPSLDVVKGNFPNYSLETASDNVDFLMDKVVESRRDAIIRNALRASAEEVSSGHTESALLVLQKNLARLEEEGFTPSSDVDLTFDPERRWEEYLERKNLPNGLRGVATGFPTLDQAMSGIQKGQLIVIVAPPKTGKSTLAMQIANHVHLGGSVPLFQSFEMSNQEQLSRYDAMRARISHNRLLSGTLTSEEESRYKTKLRTLGNVKHKFWLSESASASTISGIANKIQLLQPDVVFIDGVYLMVDEQSGEANTPLALTNITRSLKRLAQKYQVPVIVSTQALEWKMKKGQVTAGSIGYSSSFFQDADVLLGLQREDEAVDDTRILRLMAGRNCSPMEVSLVWDWNTGDFREINGDDL